MNTQCLSHRRFYPCFLQSHKGQILAGDFFLSISIFIVALGISLLMFSYVNGQIISIQEEDFMHTAATASAELLVKTEGLPANWNQSNVRSVGLGNGDGMLNGSKLIAFVSMDYQSLADIMHVKPYEMFVTFNAINGSVINLNGTNLTLGNAPPFNAQVVKVHRSSLIGGENRTITVLNFILWRYI